MSTALDFRDIHQHPPAATKLREPLPPDPSWDAHKVYFNERERDMDKKGDEFDDFFTKEQSEGEKKNVLEATLNAAKPQQESDETLDPLGWPVDAFRSLGGRVQSMLLPNGDDDDDDEGDESNLLRRSDEDPAGEPSTAATLLSSLGVMDLKSANEMVEGVQNMFLFGAAEGSASESKQQQLNQDDHEDSEGMDKEERIKMYETTGNDDESSVEDENDGEYDEDEWEKDREVGYVAQSGSFEDVGLHDNDDKNKGTANSKQATVPDFSPVTETAVPTFKIPVPTTKSKKKKQQKSGNTAVPMICPPPAEKLQKWEEAKARPLQHLQASKKK